MIGISILSGLIIGRDMAFVKRMILLMAIVTGLLVVGQFTLRAPARDSKPDQIAPKLEIISSAQAILPAETEFSYRQQASPLFFINKHVGWVLCDESLYQTNNGGVSWSIVNDGDAANMSKVFFVNEQVGYVVIDEWVTKNRSNSLLLTEDGGRSWRRILEVGTPIYTFDIPNPMTIFVSSRWWPTQQSYDGGSTWQETSTHEELNYIFSLDGAKWWAYGGAIWHSEDRGQTWIQDVPYGLAVDLDNSDFIDQSHGWIAGSDAQIWRTASGETWSRVTNLPVSAKARFNSVDFISAKEGFVTGEDFPNDSLDNGEGRILFTGDGGSSWQVSAKFNYGVHAIRFVSNNEGWAMGKGDLLHTTDKGKTWEIVELH